MKKKQEECEICSEIHCHDYIQRNVIPDSEVLQDLADLFKIFGDPTRIRILYALSARELCVCDIAQLLEVGS